MSTWSHSHRAWRTKVDLGQRGAQATLLDSLGAIDVRMIRRDVLEATIGELVDDSPWAQTAARVRCMRGIDPLSVVGLCAEVGNFERFERPGPLMSYLGLVPSENSSRETRRQGAITKSGSRHAPGCWSRPPGTTAKRRAWARRSSAAKKLSPQQ